MLMKRQGLSYIEKLINQIEEVRPIVNEMLDNSSIYYYDPNKDPDNIFFVVSNFYHWETKDERNQIRAKEKYFRFYKNFGLLLDRAQPETLRRIQDAHGRIINLIDQNNAPNSIESGKELFDNQVNRFKDFLNLLANENKKTIILPDTNSIIQFPEPKSYKSISPTERFNFVVLPTVLSELDKHKVTHRNDDFRKKVTSVVKRLKGYRNQGDILEGVVVEKTITVKMIATEPSFNSTLDWLDPNNNDDRIIASALSLQVANPNDNVIFVTSDINLQNKAQLACLSVFDTDELE